MPDIIRRCVYTLHFLAASIVGGLLLPVVSAAALAIALVRGPKGHAAVFAARTYSRFMQRVLGWKIEAEGVERLADVSPSVVMVRHQSNLDVIVAGEVSPPGAIAIGKKQLEWIPLFGWLWSATGNVLIDRRHTAVAMEAIRRAAESAKAVGVSVWVAPEGHRNMGAEMLPFKKGGFNLALRSGCDIVPVVIGGSRRIVPKGSLKINSGTFDLHIGQPIPTKGLSKRDTPALMERVRGAILNQLAVDDSHQRSA